MKLNKGKKRAISFTLLMLIILMGIPSISSLDETASSKTSPQLSLPKITIDYPIDGNTYTPLMNGYYPGTYSFEDETVGDRGTGIDFIEEDYSGSDCYVEVIEEEGGHKNVLKLDDSSSVNVKFYHLLDSSQTHGTIEYWLRAHDASKGQGVKIFDTDNYQLFALRIDDDQFQYSDGTWKVITDAPIPQDDTWYHVRIEFRCGSSEYKGLAQYNWRVYINDVGYDDYEFIVNRPQIDRIYFTTKSSDVGVTTYYDAFGFSWDPNYNSGENSPLFGYYPGTFGFEDEIVGDMGKAIDFVEEDYSGSNCYVKVIEEKGGHKNVLKLDDSSLASVKFYYLLKSSQTHGTIEYWLRAHDASKGQGVKIFDTDNYQLFALRIDDDQFQYSDGTWKVITGAPIPQDNTWYHIRIEFRCGSSEYKGLEQHKWRVYINDVGYDDYEFIVNRPQIDRIYFTTKSSDVGVTTYYDAFGFSWDPSYTIRDNRYEGLFLDITPNNLEATYQLDSNPNVDISGDTVIPIPQNGYHTITVSCPTYQDGNVDFYTKSIDPPLSGEVSQEPDHGYYPGTYGFERDFNQLELEGWGSFEGSGNCHVVMGGSSDGHYKTLRLSDNGNQNGLDLAKVWNIFKGQSQGTIEYWFKSDYGFNNQYSYMLVHDQTDEDYQIYVMIIDGTLQYRNELDTDFIDTNYEIFRNRWYHFKITFECSNGGYDGLSADTYNVYIDGSSSPVINNAHFTGGGVSQLDKLIFQTKGSAYWYSNWYDAVGFSWDPNYNVGDNQYEGVLLEDEYTDYEWVKYSYNGGSITPLNGDKVFPLFDNTHHSIQLIGKDLNGAYRCSKITYYTYSSWFVEFDLSRHWGLTDKSTFVVDAWSKCKGEGVKVLVIDSGIDLDHPDLIDNYKGGVNYYDSGPPEDSQGHGTKCSGVIAANDNYFGSIGVAPNVDLYVARVGHADSDSDTVILAIEWAINNDMDIISISLTGNQYDDDDLHDALEVAYQAGIVMVGASGNEGTRGVKYPAVYGRIIAVGSVDEYKRRSDFSCYGPNLELVAPGEEIYTTKKNNDYGDVWGTSFACPIVAGVCALILSASSTIYDKTGGNRVQAVRECLHETAEKVGGVPYDENGKHIMYGYGMVNALAAVEYALTEYP